MSHSHSQIHYKPVETAPAHFSFPHNRQFPLDNFLGRFITTLPKSIILFLLQIGLKLILFVLHTARNRRNQNKSALPRLFNKHHHPKKASFRTSRPALSFLLPLSNLPIHNSRGVIASADHLHHLDSLQILDERRHHAIRRDALHFIASPQLSVPSTSELPPSPPPLLP